MKQLMKILSLKAIVVLLFHISIYNYATAQLPTKTSNSSDQWIIKWNASDEFNSSSVDWSKWIKTGNLPNTTAWKWDNAQNVKVNNGIVELTMRQNPANVSDGGTYFKSGILKSYSTFTTGYFEAKIKGASIGEGVCPAFWLFSNFDTSVGEGQTVYSEIDIVELQQFDWYENHQDDIRDVDMNLHAVVKKNGVSVWRRPKQYPNEQLNKWRAPWDPTKDYHIYGCEVNDQEIIWYIDGVQVARKPNTFWKRPMNVTLSLGLRKPFVKFYDNRNNPINPETDPAASAKLKDMPTTMYVDYVRVWEKSNNSNTPPVGVTGINLNKTSLNLREGESTTLIATVLPTNATNKKVFWSLTDNTYASVDVNGRITALKAGSTIVIATTQDGNKIASHTLAG